MIILLVISILMDESPSLPQQAISDEHLKFFETDVRPLLADHCLRCHGSKKQWADLRLDSRAAMLQGGDSGPSVIPGQPDASLLIRAIRHEDENLKMPQDDKLSDRQIETLVQWVAMGSTLNNRASSKPRPIVKPTATISATTVCQPSVTT